MGYLTKEILSGFDKYKVRKFPHLYLFRFRPCLKLSSIDNYWIIDRQWLLYIFAVLCERHESALHILHASILGSSRIGECIA
jgi:hypothetical protein